MALDTIEGPPSDDIEGPSSDDIVPSLDSVAGLLHHVAVVHWPGDEEGLEQLRLKGIPRLLLVAPDAPAPSGLETDEDWVRLPASDDDVRARAEALAFRSGRPLVIGDGRIVHREAWVPLSQAEEALAKVLVDRFGSVVPAAELAASCGDRDMSANAVRVHLTRLRKRIRSIGLVVRSVRGRGYVMEAAGDS